MSTRHWGMISGALLLATPLLYATDEKEDSFSLAFWDKTVNLRGALGYKDNVLLSRAQPEASAFWLSAFDFTLLRAALDNTPTVTFFVSGEDRRYFSAPDLDKEQLLLSQAKITKTFGSDWTAGFLAQYLYDDQVFDASSSESIFEILPVKSHDAQFGPLLTRNLPWHSTIELRFTAEREIFEQPLDSYWQYGPRVTFAKKYGNHSEASLSYAFNYRVYDTREELNLDFTPLTGSFLRFDQHEFEAAVDHSWDEERRWRTRLKFLFQINEDNGNDFFSFYKYRLSGRAGYFRKDWQATIEGKILHYDYWIQPVRDGNAVRQTWEYVASAHVEKAVWKKVKIFVEAEHDTVNSDYLFEQYHANTVFSGFDWEF